MGPGNKSRRVVVKGMLGIERWVQVRPLFGKTTKHTHTHKGNIFRQQYVINHNPTCSKSQTISVKTQPHIQTQKHETVFWCRPARTIAHSPVKPVYACQSPSPSYGRTGRSGDTSEIDTDGRTGERTDGRTDGGTDTLGGGGVVTVLHTLA